MNWISVDERLPEREGFFLIAFADSLFSTEDQKVKVGYFYRGKVWGDGDTHHYGGVTHWSPLPPAPAPKPLANTAAPGY